MMNKEHLARMLDDGWSYERIARDVGLNPSTVAYWARKHGLRSRHAERHRGRGGLRRQELAALVAAGCSTREIAATLEVSQTAVRHWLRTYELQTKGAERRHDNVAGEESQRVARRCRSHGETRFVLEGRGYYRCARCRMERCRSDAARSSASS